MMGRRSPLFWALAVLFMALGAWWTLHVPYAPDRLYAAVPRDVVFLTEHRDLARRWEDFSGNPVTRSLLISLGLQSADLADLGRDPESRAWLDQLVPRQVVLGFVPRLGRRGEPAWVMASWLGGGSQRLRWKLSWQRGRDFVRCTSHHGRVFWKVRTASADPDMKLTVALVEGLLLACLSRHEDAMNDVLDTCDGFFPSLADRGDFPGPATSGQSAAALDRGWVDARAWVRGSDSPAVYAYEFSELTASSLVGQVRGPALSVADTGSQAAAAETEGLEPLLGDLPLAAAVFDRASVIPLLASKSSPGWVRAAADVIRGEEADSVVAVVLGGDYSGRFKGIKVPSLLVGLRVRDEARSLARMQQAMDRLNAKYRWGLIPREVPAGERTLRAVESTGDGTLASLPLAEKPAYAVFGDWMLFASNLESLQKLADRFAVPVEGAGIKPRWLEGLESDPARGYVWVDLVRGGKTLKLAMVTYSLKLMVRNEQGTARARRRMDEAKTWIDSLAPMDTLTVRMPTAGDPLEWTFRLGPGNP